MSNERELRFQASELRFAEAGVVTGLAVPYNVWTPIGGAYLERCVPETFARSISEHPNSIPFMTLHDTSKFAVGKAVNWEHSERGLVGTWQMDTSERAVEVTRLMREGMVTGLSVGFAPDPGADVVEADENGVVRVTRMNARLYEVSAVSVPASAEAQIMAVRTVGVPEVKVPEPPRSQKSAIQDRKDTYKAWVESNQHLFPDRSGDSE